MPATVAKGKRGRPRKYASEQERREQDAKRKRSHPRVISAIAGAILAEPPFPPYSQTELPSPSPAKNYLDQFLPSCGALEAPAVGELAGDNGHESEVGPPRADLQT
ncbi:hypothetical protein BDV33DRAFT_201281 [Aspergillus novoparasiticus]|uniref:Uncharacterized protein n=1 Tax=Aspergillus novoparasiticus TaxID=986946 RepID=A0A5N6EYF9_9EURO|nr:hypothetical protein BDV33DRAFT_201281 [Aspergillus novoparasiticus]